MNKAIENLLQLCGNEQRAEVAEVLLLNLSLAAQSLSIESAKDQPNIELMKKACVCLDKNCTTWFKLRNEYERDIGRM